MKDEGCIGERPDVSPPMTRVSRLPVSQSPSLGRQFVRWHERECSCYGPVANSAALGSSSVILAAGNEISLMDSHDARLVQAPKPAEEALRLQPFYQGKV